MHPVTQTSAPVVITGLEGLESHVGQTLGVSDWKTVAQDDINTFAKLTNDEQWIHVDPERAKETPIGTTIQHGFLSLSMSTGLLWSVCVVEGFSMILNYGLNKVRFPQMLPTGSRYRAHVELADVKQLGASGVEVVWRLTYEIEGQSKPGCVADLVFRYYS
jgi:acyl dehydratase